MCRRRGPRWACGPAGFRGHAVAALPVYAVAAQRLARLPAQVPDGLSRPATAVEGRAVGAQQLRRERAQRSRWMVAASPCRTNHGGGGQPHRAGLDRGGLRQRGTIRAFPRRRKEDGGGLRRRPRPGRHILTVDDARGSLPLAMYALAAERVMRRRCRRVELHHLPTGRVIAFEHTDSTLARQLHRAEDIAAECAAADERFKAGLPADRYDEVFPPSPRPACGWCDYLRHCPEGRLAATPRQPWDGLMTPGDADACDEAPPRCRSGPDDRSGSGS